MNKLMFGIVAIVLLAPIGPASAQKINTIRPPDKPTEIPLEAYMESRRGVIDTITACHINHYPFCEKYVTAAEEWLAKNDVYAEPDHTPFNEASQFCYEENPEANAGVPPYRIKSSIEFCRRLNEYANHWTAVPVGGPNCHSLSYWAEPCWVLRRK